MHRFARMAAVASALSLGVMLTGCETFDPTDIFNADMFSTKKKLQGERKPVFPEGTPGVSQGVPQELVKGYQPPTEPEPGQAAPEEPKAKPKPKPKTAAKPAPPPEERAPAPAAQQQPPPRQQPASGGWGSQGGVAWPDSPSTTR